MRQANDRDRYRDVVTILGPDSVEIARNGLYNFGPEIRFCQDVYNQILRDPSSGNQQLS
jgi:hypothetical protein